MRNKFPIVKGDNRRNVTIHIVLFQPCMEVCSSPFIARQGNLLVFPAAARPASGLYTGLCSGHRGHVRCLGVWRWREREREKRRCYPPSLKDIKYVKAGSRQITFIFAVIQIFEDNNYSINFSTVLSA